MKKENENKKGFKLVDIIFLVVFTSIVTSITTGVIVYNQNRLTKNIALQDLSKDDALKEFLKVYASLIDEYYEDVNKTAMLESAIEGMFNYLGEDYSTYMNKEETNNLANQLKGEYKGIGIKINKMDNSITGFIEGGSAKEAGLLVGDIIIAVNDKEIKSSEEIISVIENTKEDTELIIVVNRNGETLNFQVMNKKLYIPAIEYYVNEEHTGYLKMKTFSNTLGEQVRIALKQMEENGMQSLVIDLRDNTGGYLSAAKDVASMFLEKGKTIYSLEDKNTIEDFKDETDEKREYKIVVLFNGSSASASEVLISALKESYGATTVGTVSYGKGKVQQTRTLEDGSMVKYTSAKWLTPTRNCIDGIGITPDYVVEANLETKEIDEQLNVAFELSR